MVVKENPSRTTPSSSMTLFPSSASSSIGLLFIASVVSFSVFLSLTGDMSQSKASCEAVRDFTVIGFDGVFSCSVDSS